MSEQQPGLASGLVNMTQQVGAAIGLAILVALSSSRTTDALHDGIPGPEALSDGYSVAFVAGAGLAATAALVAAAILVRRTRAAAPQPVVAPAEGVA